MHPLIKSLALSILIIPAFQAQEPPPRHYMPGLPDIPTQTDPTVFEGAEDRVRAVFAVLYPNHAFVSPEGGIEFVKGRASDGSLGVTRNREDLATGKTQTKIFMYEGAEAGTLHHELTHVFMTQLRGTARRNDFINEGIADMVKWIVKPGLVEIDAIQRLLQEASGPESIRTTCFSWFLQKPMDRGQYTLAAYFCSHVLFYAGADCLLQMDKAGQTAEQMEEVLNNALVNHNITPQEFWKHVYENGKEWR